MENVSFASEDLIKELKQDILEFGKETMFAVWLRKYGNLEFVVNFDFVVEEAPITKDQIGENERLIFMDGTSLLNRLEEQNKIF